MNRVRVWLVTIGLALIAALPAAAQIQTGSILVRVTDDQGASVPGVAVTLNSPVLVSGTMAGVTDSGGVNRFPSLPPGVYSVKVELQGFRSVIREGVPPLVHGTMAQAHLWVLQRRETGFTVEARRLTAGKTPLWSLEREGVPLLEIYANDEASQSAASEAPADGVESGP